MSDSSQPLEARNPKAHLHIGMTLADAGQYPEAIARFHAAIRHRSDWSAPVTQLARTYRALGRWNDAVRALRRALDIDPNEPEALVELARVWQRAGRLDESVAHLEKVTRLHPSYAPAHLELGNSQRELGRLDRALASFRRALALRPRCSATRRRIIVTLLMAGRGRAALEFVEHELRKSPEAIWLRTSRADGWLRLGDFARGWRELEVRWQKRTALQRPFSQPEWDGRPLRGRRILIYGEQGLGDRIQFVRYAALVRARGGRVILSCQRRLRPLLASCPGIERIVVDGEVPAFDCHAALMSLPAILGTTLESVPARVPYLSPQPELLLRWRERLAGEGGFKVGVVWQGNPRHPHDRRRSFPLRCLAPLARVGGVKLYSLQVGSGVEQMAASPGFALHRFERPLDRGGFFVDTAAIMKGLDLVVGPDSSAIHVAGALGVPVWVALSTFCDFRWMETREDSPWYPTMRLFRQERCDDWAPVFERMAHALAAELSARSA